MTIIDRYLLRIYVKALIVCLVSLFGLFVVIDAFNNLDEFLSYGKRYSGGTAAVLAQYYGPRLLWFFDRTGGMLALASAGFVLTLLQRTNEMTALFAAGISPARLVKPLLAASLVVALLGAANREWGLPQVRDLLARNAQDWLGQSARKCTPRYDLHSNILITGKSTFAKERRIEEPLFRLPPVLAAWGRQLAADNAAYQSATQERPGGYLLHGVRQPTNVSTLPSHALDGKPVLLSPFDTPWLAPDQCFVVSVVTFEQLTAGSSWQRYLSSIELITGLRGGTIEPGADVRLTLHNRVIQPLLDLSLVLLGVPLVLSRGSHSILMTAVVGGGIITSWTVVVLACHAAGASYFVLNATLAAWLPLLIFGPVAYAAARPMWD
jgi:lipopolysaccharide export system permease protein